MAAPELRLSALRAFLGRIHPEMRLIKVKSIGNEIVVSIVLDAEPTDRIREDVSEATTEIISDFRSPYRIKECFEVSKAPLMSEDIFSEGWIYQRAE